ncbi:ead/Ea22-like family protein [Salmonella enterica]|uniref:ead/Ea22-like family protein n=1 Tax=Salmonella enterica TaxID=28901 RepID=UPI0009AFA0A0|nr:ead/Ea22-like family protein [Salmonella enterica]EBX1128056.1 ead/Ea22-like family protein [Salmonella enterica subsp. enterica serovar Guinea]EDB7834700.1 ead/Ea22-like family protein [Salmonella enterica subsp. enterica serovar Infantis]EDS4601411.1 ead/Ea22-like family protein [Salmonella enterica subsp. enterica serovar Ouakam]EDT7306436.1 ead/Ea22-like family protein [Salmonella enterica subsp. enterica]EAB2881748.1 ead/Ea22-like family protein [Salmonella enterica]
MSNIDKQALREEFRLMQAHYSDPADRARQVIYIAAEALLDELDKKQQYIKLRDQENEDIALTVGKLRVELEHYKSREERVTKLVLDNSTSWDVLYEKLEAAERSMAEQSAIVAAAEKLVRCKGRYHSELNYRALAKLFGVITPDLPPLVHENVHYADAADVEITALRQRIAELEARVIVLPQRLSPEGYHIDEAYMVDDTEGEYLDRDAVIDAIRAAGIGVKGE